MVYADTDFFLALFKPTDWLKESAKQLLAQHADELWTSSSTVTELLLICKEYHLDPLELMVSLFKMVQVKGIDREIAFAAAHYIRNHSLTPFDALHAAFCGNDVIISSDKVYEKIGLQQIRLGK